MVHYYEERTLSVYLHTHPHQSSQLSLHDQQFLFETVKLICRDFVANKHLISLSSNNAAVVLQTPSNEILIIF